MSKFPIASKICLFTLTHHKGCCPNLFSVCVFVPDDMKLLGTDVASIPTNEVAPHQFGLAVVVTSRGVQRSLSNLMRKHENVCSPLMEDIRVGLMLEFDKLTEGSSFFLVL